MSRRGDKRGDREGGPFPHHSLQDQGGERWAWEQATGEKGMQAAAEGGGLEKGHYYCHCPEKKVAVSQSVGLNLWKKHGLSVCTWGEVGTFLELWCSRRGGPHLQRSLLLRVKPAPPPPQQ